MSFQGLDIGCKLSLSLRFLIWIVNRVWHVHCHTCDSVCVLSKLNWILIPAASKDPPHSHLMLWMVVSGPFLYIGSILQSNVVWRHNLYLIFTAFNSSLFPLTSSTLFTHLWIFLIRYNISNKELIHARYNTLVVELSSLWVFLVVYNKPGCGQPQLTQTWIILLGKKVSGFPNKTSNYMNWEQISNDKIHRGEVCIFY
jgi:hypothetical protein